MRFLGSFNPTIRLTVVVVFLLATTLTAGIAIGLQYYFGHILAKDSARDLYTLASQGVANEISYIGAKSSNVIELLAENEALSRKANKQTYLKDFSSVMQKNPLHYGIYLGHADGSFFELINLDSSDVARKSLRALPTDKWLVIQVVVAEGGGRERQFSYYDQDMVLRLSRSEPTDFDPTSRAWYIDAMTSGQVVRSAPYLFAQLGQPGQTVSMRVRETDTVVGIDITMSSISRFLAGQKIAEYGDLFLYTVDGDVVASSINDAGENNKVPLPQFTLTPTEQALVANTPLLHVSNEMSWAPFDYSIGGMPQGYSVDVIRLIGEMTGLQFNFRNGYSWTELTEMFKAGEIDLLQSVIPTEVNAGWGLTSESYVHLPYALATRSDVDGAKNFAALAGKTLAIPAGWSVIAVVRALFPEIKLLETDSTLSALQAVLDGSADAALDNEVILRHVAAHYYLTGISYQSEPDFSGATPPDTLRIMVDAARPELMALINRALAAIGQPQRDYLATEWLDFSGSSGTGDSGQVPDQILLELTTNADMRNTLLQASSEGQEYYLFGTPLNAANSRSIYFGVRVPEAAITGPFMEKVKLSILISSGFLLLMLPMSWAFASPIVKPIKQLSIENDKVRDRHYDEVREVRSNIKELDELSESMVAMVGSIQAHELAQRRLMDAFIQLIAGAIDEKSPYTGGHCERVPELALMLAAAASDSQQPPFNTFKLETEDQWREYRIAAWLHDCGKITTPEHIVDKGSKLETIYNRIHEVRMRFEVLHREVEIDYWQALAEHPDQRESLIAERKQKQWRLQEDYVFIANCNVGGEFLDEASQQRLQEVGSRVWHRYFDDRIGLSPVEELKLSGVAPSLPVEEKLLADKPEHIIERTRSTDYPPQLGINMDIPEHLFNQGEIYNLSISRGTLTAEDRFKINEHMISTIRMLESLPFPDELKNVPRYASTHHETMRGDGYPRKLGGDQLSIPERILAVADIFEALTASDRPYKKAKPVSVAVEILYKMMLDDHVDRDCFELFISSGVYLQYAKTYLAEDQIDVVEVSKYLSASA